MTAERSRWGRYGGKPLVALCLVGLVDAIDKGVLPGVLPKVQRDLGISDTEAGLLYTSLIVASLLFAVPGGVLSDRRDRRVLVSIVLGVWSVSTALAAAVQSFWQLLTLRAVLGAGDSVNDPAVQSLVADYYPAEVRGRAYAWQRVVPTVGTGLGLGLGAALGAAFGWRIAVLAVAIPGISVALLVRKLPQPIRGGADDTAPLEADPVHAVVEAIATRQALRRLLAVPSLRALLLATAVINGILTALGFWGVTYHVRASGMSEGKAGGIAGGLILLGAIAGGILGGQATDRFRHRFSGWPMLLAALVTGGGTILLMGSFLDGIPVYTVRLPLQTLGVALVVASLPPLTVTTAEVVPAALRGSAFGLLKLCANGLGAIAPPLIGMLADTRKITLANGEVVGDLGHAFRLTAPLVLVGAALLLLGRRHLDEDVRKAGAPVVAPPLVP
ncbi:MAG TPA: MFS transporter [Mycobacteriales bacterium]|nr:MFS transporter [Mycobacteriales bacterium]